jgi:hypothetical protein
MSEERDWAEADRQMEEEFQRLVRQSKQREAARLRKKRENDFVMVSLSTAATAMKGQPRALVWIQLLRLAFEEHSLEVRLSNARLAELGVDRWAKYRALEELEEAGLLEVTRQPGRATLVKLREDRVPVRIYYR